MGGRGVGAAAIQSGPWSWSLCTARVPRPVSHWTGLSHLQPLKGQHKAAVLGEGDRASSFPFCCTPSACRVMKGPECPHHAHPADSIYCLACSWAAPRHQLLGSKNKAHTRLQPQPSGLRKTEVDTLASCLGGKGLKPARSDQEAGPG